MTLSEILTGKIRNQISNLSANCSDKVKITATCDCGAQTIISTRAFVRKWQHRDEYLCKSCSVKTYVNEPERIAKFRASFAKIAATTDHIKKCKAAGEKAWIHQETRDRITEAVRQDNITNPKKAKARKIALEALQLKPWFENHMDEMRAKVHETQRLTTNTFVARALLVHDYDYSAVEYINFDSKVKIKCEIHGIFEQAPRNHLNGQGCPKCAVVISNDHQAIINMLPKDIEIINNARDVLQSEIDIWLPQFNVGIEIHGEYWHGLRPGLFDCEASRIMSLHLKKANQAQTAGIRLYQFWTNEIQQKPELVRSMIMNAIGKSKRIYARDCDVRILDKQPVSFYNSNHLQGNRFAAINLGLFYKDEIICGLNLSRHNKHEWEIIRFATKQGYLVIGGFSRLLTHFIRSHDPNQIMTFADRRFSTGGVYMKYGFKPIEVTKPNYFYVLRKQTLSRQHCQKHKLSKLLGMHFDPSQTETVNMLNCGFSKVYDAGHIKLLWSKYNSDQTEENNASDQLVSCAANSSG